MSERSRHDLVENRRFPNRHWRLGRPSIVVRALMDLDPSAQNQRHDHRDDDPPQDCFGEHALRSPGRNCSPSDPVCSATHRVSPMGLAIPSCRAARTHARATTISDDPDFAHPATFARDLYVEPGMSARRSRNCTSTEICARVSDLRARAPGFAPAARTCLSTVRLSGRREPSKIRGDRAPRFAKVLVPELLRLSCPPVGAERDVPLRRRSSVG